VKLHDTLVDFHMHTNCSDGAWTPSRLFEEIRTRRLEYFSISDHDTMDAYPVPTDLQDRCIAGLEIDTETSGQTVHVLAYSMNRLDGRLMSRLKQQRLHRATRAEAIVERLNKSGVDLTFEQVLEVAKTSESIGRPHIARALVEKNYSVSIQAAFDEFLAEGCCAYVALDRLSTAEGIELIHEAGALAVLAHPRRLRDQVGLPEFCKLFDGVEIVHPSADHEYVQKMLDLVDANALIATGGTDFHARPGDSGIGIALPAPRVSQLLERLHT